MKRNLSKNYRMSKVGFALVSPCLLIGAISVATFGQSSKTRSENNPFSPSPIPNSTPEIDTNNSKPAEFIMQARNSIRTEPQPTHADMTKMIEKKPDLSRLSPSKYYKIGPGDVLFVRLTNTSQPGGYYTVRTDGTIDFPLGGQNIVAAGNTIDELKEIIVAGIKVIPDPQIELRLREFASHKITVSGLATHTGVKFLQREAIPLFVIRAEAELNSEASKVDITRSNSGKTESHRLDEKGSEDILIFPGDKVTFLKDADYYFISGDSVTSGQMQFSPGLRLYQAVVASGGTRADPKSAIVRRKNEKGILIANVYDLRSIKNGKSPDPVLAAGDIIEISK